MANRKIIVGLLVLCLSVYFTECKGGRSSGRSSSSGSRGGSSWGRGWGGSSSGSSWSKPSSSGSSNSWSKPSSGSSSYGYPHSTGLSGSSGSRYPSTNTGSHSYPSGSGLSGTGSRYPSTNTGSHSYPSGSGLSGTGSKYPSTNTGSHSYPSGSGLSGTGSRYPSTNTGSHSYPSGSGLSGTGSKYPSTNTGSHSYPSGTGLSGGGSRHPSTNTGSYGNNNYPSSGIHNNPSSSHVYHHTIPHTYYTAPQHVYITQYQDSGSKYSNLLTGLTLYNMGRSHSHYRDHYYYDDYYRHRYQSTGSSNYQSTYNKPNDVATCTLRIKENGNVEVLKIPCEIVSTFTGEGKKIENEPNSSHRVCTSNVTTTNIIPVSTSTASLPEAVNMTTLAPTNVTVSNVSTINITAKNVTGQDLNNTEQIASIVPVESTTSASHLLENDIRDIQDSLRKAMEGLDHNIVNLDEIFKNVESPSPTNTVASTTSTTPPSTTTPRLTEYETELKRMGAEASSHTGPITIRNTKTDGDTTIETIKTLTATQTVVNVTTCTQNFTDPLKVKGSAINPSNMECSVDIKTKETHFRNAVACTTLMEYSRMPVPQKESKPLLPSREKLKSWLEKPPWWMSMLIAV